MSCCSSSNELEISKHKNCPSCDARSLQVSYSTVLQHLAKPWVKDFENSLKSNTFYFCGDSDCNAVYFTQSDVVFSKTDVRTIIGLKEQKNNNALACYCFDITLAEAKHDSSLEQYVINMTKQNMCACESQNPSGRCCLKDFPS